jgi:hypothetical protein
MLESVEPNERRARSDPVSYEVERAERVTPGVDLRVSNNFFSALSDSTNDRRFCNGRLPCSASRRRSATMISMAAGADAQKDATP